MKKFVWLFNVIVCFALIFCMMKINDLQHQVKNLSNSIHRIDRNLNNDMQSIYSNVQELLEEESNQLTISDWEYGKIDVENRNAEIICTVVPKEYNPSVTKAKLISDDHEYAMSYDNGKYTVKLNVPLFETMNIQQVNLIDKGTVRTQEVGWIIDPKAEALLWTYVHFSGEGRGSYGDTAYTWKSTGKVDFNIERKGSFEVKKIDLIEVMDGKEINRINVDISEEGQRKYQEQLAKKGQSIPISNSASADVVYEGTKNFIYPLIKEIVVPNGSEYMLYADITDGYDLTYRCFVDCISIDKNGNHNEVREDELRMYMFDSAFVIFDKDGNVVYSSEVATKLNYNTVEKMRG